MLSCHYVTVMEERGSPWQGISYPTSLGVISQQFSFKTVVIKRTGLPIKKLGGRSGALLRGLGSPPPPSVGDKQGDCRVFRGIVQIITRQGRHQVCKAALTQKPTRTLGPMCDQKKEKKKKSEL